MIGATGLELAKLLTQAATPVVVAVIGFWLNRRLKSIESAQWAQQKLLERRIVTYDKVSPKLNRLYCYFAYVGAWKEISPPEVIALKRELDQAAHTEAPLFGDDFMTRYNALMERCFDTHQCWGKDAKLRTDPAGRRDSFGDSWLPEWEHYFSHDPSRDDGAVVEAYSTLMAYLARAIGVESVNRHLFVGEVSAVGEFSSHRRRLSRKRGGERSN